MGLSVLFTADKVCPSQASTMHIYSSARNSQLLLPKHSTYHPANRDITSSVPSAHRDSQAVPGSIQCSGFGQCCPQKAKTLPSCTAQILPAPPLEHTSCKTGPLRSQGHTDPASVPGGCSSSNHRSYRIRYIISHHFPASLPPFRLFLPPFPSLLGREVQCSAAGVTG